MLFKIMLRRKTLFRAFAVAGFATWFIFTQHYFTNEDYFTNVITYYEEASSRFLDKTSKNGRSIFLLGQPSLEPDWYRTTIFGNDSTFLTLGFPEGSNFFNHFNLNALASVEECGTMVTVITCTRPPQNSGLMSEDCSKLLQNDLSKPLFSQHASHVYVKFANSKCPSVLIAKLYQISPPERSNYYSQFFCYGLSSLFVHSDKNFAHNRTTTCPPCLCASVFSGRTLSQNKLDLSDIYLSPYEFFTRTDRVFLEIRTATLLLKHSRLVTCLKRNESTIEKPSDIYTVGDSPAFGAEHAWAVRELFQRYNMPTTLEGGVLLGWYRNCSVIAHDDDIDLAVPSWAVNADFYATILQSAYVDYKPLRFKMVPIDDAIGPVTLRTARVFGDMESGVEVRFDARRENDANDVGVDVFIFFVDEGPGYKDNRKYGYEYFLGFYERRNSLLHNVIPKNGTALCSTIFLGQLYMVPCNPEVYLESSYGPGWRYPTVLEPGYWSHQPNGRLVEIPYSEWQRRVMYRPFVRFSFYWFCSFIPVSVYILCIVLLLIFCLLKCS